MELSVVVATHNRQRRLRALLKSLRAQTAAPGAFEVVIVDDASTDGTPALLEAEARRGALDLRVLRRERSAGPAAARNAGWRAARAPLVAFTDDDCVVAPGWVEGYLAAAREQPGAVVQGRTDPMPEEMPNYGAFSYTLWVHGPTPWFETCNILYPRSLLERLGGFDETSFTGPGGEDTDLGWRARRAGAPTSYAEAAHAFHAVLELGPVGRLRRAARWTETMSVFARYPELRREAAVHRVFWKRSHYWLVRAALATVLPRRAWPLQWWLAAPYVVEAQRSGPWLWPYVLVHDLVEVYAVLRGAWRYRTIIV